jgi:hypothetical protein
MAGRFYLSTKKDRSDEGARVSRGLVERGWECTFDWTSLSDSTIQDSPKLAQLEIEGIRQADVLIVLLPGGFGTHAEIGAAIAFEKPIIIHSPSQAILDTPYPCVFHYHPTIKMIVSERLDLDAVLDALPT